MVTIGDMYMMLCICVFSLFCCFSCVCVCVCFSDTDIHPVTDVLLYPTPSDPVIDNSVIVHAMLSLVMSPPPP